MVKKGCEWDNAAYNVCIVSAQSERPERVKELIQQMSKAGLKPDTISYKYFVTAYCEKGMLDEAKKVYEGLQGHGCAPNTATFRTLVFRLCYSGFYEQAYAIFEKNACVHKIPIFNTLKHLVVGLVKNNKINEAEGLIRTMKKKFPMSFLNAWKKLEESLGLYTETKGKEAVA